MNKYTIKPIARLLREQPRACYTYKDLVQLAQRWQNPKNAPLPAVREIYLAAITELKNNCRPGQKISRARIIELVDSYIKEHDLCFLGKPAECVRSNYFALPPTAPIKRYDLAYYHPGHPGQPHRPSYHGA